MDEWITIHPSFGMTTEAIRQVFEWCSSYTFFLYHFDWLPIFCIPVTSQELLSLGQHASFVLKFQTHASMPRGRPMIVWVGVGMCVCTIIFSGLHQSMANGDRCRVVPIKTAESWINAWVLIGINRGSPDFLAYLLHLHIIIWLPTKKKILWEGIPKI